MKLSDLILAVGDEHIAFQVLDADASEFRMTKAGMRIVFHTGAVDGSDLLAISRGGATAKMGLVVWLPRDKVEAAVAASKQEAAGG